MEKSAVVFVVHIHVITIHAMFFSEKEHSCHKQKRIMPYHQHIICKYIYAFLDRKI